MESSTDDSASHQALLNQCLKSDTASVSLSSLVKCRSRSSRNVVATIWLPSRELRAKFDELALVQVALAEEYTCCLHKATLVRLGDGTEAMSLTVGFEDQRGVRRLTVHTYVDDAGRIISRGGKLDPKFFLDEQQVAYKIDQR